MTEKIREQIMAIRDSGRCNLLDITQVQRLAFEQDFHELVVYLEENRSKYIRFVLYGDDGL